jgi:hypothetical protein
MGSLREFCQCGRTFLSSVVMYAILSDQLQVKLFNLDTPQPIQSNEHASTVIHVGENGDVMNEACALNISPAFPENLPSDIC